MEISGELFRRSLADPVGTARGSLLVVELRALPLLRVSLETLPGESYA